MRTVINVLAELLWESIREIQGLRTLGYRFGGESPTGGFDCSGLIYYALSKAGLLVPRTDVAGFWDLTQVEPDLRWGALAKAYKFMFWSDNQTPTKAGSNHMGLFIAEDLVLESTSAGELIGSTDVFNDVMEWLSSFDDTASVHDGMLSKDEAIALIQDFQAWLPDASDGLGAGVELLYWNIYDSTYWFPNGSADWSFAADRYRDTAKEIAKNTAKLAVVQYIAKQYDLELGIVKVDEFRKANSLFDLMSIWTYALKSGFTQLINDITGKSEHVITLVELDAAAQTALGVGFMDGLRTHYYAPSLEGTYFVTRYLSYDESLIAPVASAMAEGAKSGVNLKAHTVRGV